MYRVLARYFGISTPINSTKGIKEFKQLAQSLIDHKQPGTFNQAIMDFGSLQCKPQNPDCEQCPLQDSCVAFDKKQIKELPVKEKKLKIKKRYFNYLVIVTKDEKTILEERKGKGIWQGLYQFPLIESTKDIADGILDHEEFKNKIPSKSEVQLFNETEIVHKLSHQHLHTRFWIVKVNEHLSATISWSEVNKYPIPVLIDNFLKHFLSASN